MPTLTGKQKSYLRSLAQTLKPVLQIGKEGLTEPLLKAMNDHIAPHELMKVSILPTSPESLEAIFVTLNAQKMMIVQEIGNVLVLYKQNRKLEKGIRLPSRNA